MKSRSRTTSSQWSAALSRPTSPSIRSPKAPSNVMVTTPVSPAQVVIQGGWTPSGLAVNVGRHHSRSLASSHDSDVNMLLNDGRLPATGSRSVETRFSGLPSLPESNKSMEYNGSLRALIRKSAEVANATSMGKSVASIFWSKSPFPEMLPMVRSSKSVTVKRSGVILASTPSAGKVSMFEKHGELTAHLADFPIKHRTAFRSSDSVTSTGKRRSIKTSGSGTAQEVSGHQAPEILMSEEHQRLSKKRSASSARSRSATLKTARASRASLASPPTSQDVHSFYDNAALDKFHRQYPAGLAERQALLRATGCSPRNVVSIRAQSSRGQLTGLEHTSITELSKSGESRRLHVPVSQKSSPEPFTMPLLHPSSRGPSLLADYPGLKDFTSDTSNVINVVSIRAQSSRGQLTGLEHTSRTELSKSGESRRLHVPIPEKSSPEPFTGPLLHPSSRGPSLLADYHGLKDFTSDTSNARTSPFTGTRSKLKAEFGVTTERKILGDQITTKATVTVSPVSSGSSVNIEAPQKPSIEYPTSIVEPQKTVTLRRIVDKGSHGSPPGSWSVLASAASPLQRVEMRFMPPSGGLHEPLKKFSPPASPQASKSLFAGGSTQPSLIKGAPTIGPTERSALSTESATTSTLSQRKAVPEPADTFFRTKMDALSPGAKQGPLEPAMGSTATQHKSAHVPSGSRPESPNDALREYLGATTPSLFSEPGSPRGIGGGEASAQQTLIKQATTLHDTEPKGSLMRPDIMPASTREMSSLVTAMSSPRHTANAPSLCTTQTVSVTKTTTVALSEPSPVSKTHPGSPTGLPSAVVGASSPEPLSPRAASGLLDPTKSPRKIPGTSPQASQGVLTPEPRTPQAASGFLDPTKSPRESSGITQVSQAARSLLTDNSSQHKLLEHSSPRATAGTLDPTKSPRLAVQSSSPASKEPQESSGTTQVSQGASSLLTDNSSQHKLLEHSSPRATAGILDPTKSPRLAVQSSSPASKEPQESSGITQVLQGASSLLTDNSSQHKLLEHSSPRATAGTLDPTKSPRLAVQASSPTSKTILKQTSQHQIQSPQPPSGKLSTTMSPLTPSSQVSTSISKLESIQHVANPSSTMMEIIATEKSAVSPAESGVTAANSSTVMKASSSHGTVSTFGTSARPVTVFGPSSSETCIQPVSEKSPSESSVGSPRRALSALGPASPPKESSGLASPGEIRRLLEAKGSPTRFSPQHSSSPTEVRSPADLAAGPISALGGGHELVETKTTTLQSTGSKASLIKRGSDLKLPSGSLVSSQQSSSEKKASRGSSLLVLTSADDRPTRKSSGPGSADLDKKKSSVTAITQEAGAKTEADIQKVSVRHASTELATATSKVSEDRISIEEIIDARQLEAEKSAESIGTTKLSDNQLVEKRDSASAVAQVQKKQSDSQLICKAGSSTSASGQILSVKQSTSGEVVNASDSSSSKDQGAELRKSESAEKPAPMAPETDAKGSPRKKKDKKGHKGRKAHKGSTASADDENLSLSEHIAHAITESSPDFADMPLQVNMTIDLVPPKSTSPMSPPRTIMSPVHIEKKMIVESCKDGHVEVKVPPVYIDSPDGKHIVDEALNVSVSVDVGKQATQSRKSPAEESHHPEKR